MILSEFSNIGLVSNFRGDLISRKSIFKIFAVIKFRGFRGHFAREIKSPRNLIPVKINPFKILCSILIMWCLSLHPLIIAKLKDFRLLGMLFWKGSTVLVTRWASRMRRYWGLPVIWILHGTIIPNMPPWLTGCPVTLATQLAVWSIALLALKVPEKIKIFRKS